MSMASVRVKVEEDAQQLERIFFLFGHLHYANTATLLKTTFLTASESRVFTEPVRNRLHEDGMNARRASVGPVLIQSIRDRLDSALEITRLGFPTFIDESNLYCSACVCMCDRGNENAKLRVFKGN